MPRLRHLHVLHLVLTSLTGGAAGWAVPPAPPAAVSASQGEHTDRICLTWEAVSDAAGYEVWRGEVAYTAFAVKIASIPMAETNYCDSQVDAKVAYFYWLKAVSGEGAGEFSPAVAGFRQPPMTNGMVKFQNKSRSFAAPIFGVETSAVELALFGNDPTGNPPQSQVYTGEPLTGDFAAELWGGPQGTLEFRLMPVPNSLVLFPTNLQAGYFVAGNAVAVPGVAPGNEAALQVRVWERRGGLVDTWLKAAGDPTVAKGASLVFASPPLGQPSAFAPEPSELRSFNVCYGAPPSFMAGPTNHALLAGAPVAMSGQAAGSGIVHYQWFRNGATLPGATANSLTIEAAGILHSGRYQLRASSWYGAAAVEAEVAVFSPPFPSANQLAPPFRLEGSLAMQFAGTAGQTCRLLRSGNLRNWTPVATNRITSLGMAQFIDEHPPWGTVFYQVASP